jgi:hypothetical protein
LLQYIMASFKRRCETLSSLGVEYISLASWRHPYNIPTFPKSSAVRRYLPEGERSQALTSVPSEYGGQMPITSNPKNHHGRKQCPQRTMNEETSTTTNHLGHDHYTTSHRVYKSMSPKQCLSDSLSLGVRSGDQNTATDPK